jgi:serine/threonine protein kinase
MQRKQPFIDPEHLFVERNEFEKCISYSGNKNMDGNNACVEFGTYTVSESSYAVAIKTVQPNQEGQFEDVQYKNKNEQLENELHFLQQIDKSNPGFPNIVAFFGYTLDPLSVILFKEDFCVTDLFELQLYEMNKLKPKENLQQLIPYKQQVYHTNSSILLLDLLQQCARALEFIHAIGIVHMDVKPDNLLMSYSEGAFTLRLTDFGSAQNANELRYSQGTYGYIAPEFDFDEIEIPTAVDIYSFGVTVYEIIKCEYKHENILDNEAIEFRLPDEMDGSLGSPCHEEVEETILSSLDSDPTARYSAAQLVTLFGNLKVKAQQKTEVKETQAIQNLDEENPVKKQKR